MEFQLYIVLSSITLNTEHNIFPQLICISAIKFHTSLYFYIRSHIVCYVLKPCPWSRDCLQEAMWSLNFIQSATDYSSCGNQIVEYCSANMHTCFFMQATEQMGMPLTYVVRRKQICINYVHVFNLCLMLYREVNANYVREMRCSGLFLQKVVVIPYQLFGTTYLSHLQGPPEN